MKNYRPGQRSNEPVWYNFPGRKNPRLLIDISGNIRSSIHLYHPYTLIGKLSRLFISFIPGWLIRYTLSPAKDQTALERHLTIAKKVLNNENIYIHFSTGTPGPHRKITGQICDNNKVIAYVKISSSDATKKLLENERAALNKLHSNEPEGIALPEVLGWESDTNITYLFLSAPIKISEQRKPSVDNNDIHFLNWISRNTDIISIDKLLLEDIQNNRITYNNDTQLMKILNDSVEAVSRITKSDSIQTSSCHGDYAPWNTLLLSDSNNSYLYLFDWEYYCNISPPLFDLLYRIYMPGRLLKRYSAIKMTRLLLSVFDDNRYTDIVDKFNIKESHRLAYIIMFYAWLCRRESDHESGISNYLSECIRYCMVMAKQPGYTLKVLISAYACEPDKGSEPGVGWNWADQISRHHETWVVTRKNNQDSINKMLDEHPNPNMHFIYVDPPRWLTFWKRKERGVRSYYYLWQLSAIAPALRLQRSVKFDIAHHVTFVNDWIWTFLCILPVPYIWGPLGSNVRLPFYLLPNFRDKARDSVRILIQTLVRWLDPLWWISVIRASSIMTINESVADSYPLCFVAEKKIIIEPAIGIDLKKNKLPCEKLDKQVLFVGHHIPIKGGTLIVESFSKVLEKVPDARLTLIGEGIDENKLINMAKVLDIKNSVTFEPWQSRNSVRAAMEKASIFVFPSLEAGGMVVLEAMSAGTPVVCLDFGGPGSMIDSTAGLKVPVTTRDEIIENLADSISHLLLDDNKRHALGNGAKNRAINKFSWEVKGELANKLYLKALKLTLSKNYDI